MKQVKQKLTALSLECVHFGDDFLGQRRKILQTVSLFDQYKKLQQTGRLNALNLRRKNIPRNHAWDSDVAKWVEAAAYSLRTRPDKALAAKLNAVADQFVALQQKDGYMNSYFQAEAPQLRWTNLACEHELYQAGHIIEAAVAHEQTTGRRDFLDAACRLADHIDAIFGRGKEKKRGYPGHQEIELALVKLYKATGRKRYLRLASYFLEERGRRPHYFALEAQRRGEDPKSLSNAYGLHDYSYFQAHLPARQQTIPVGHAVRAVYMYSAMADVAVETNDRELLSTCRELWRNVMQKQMYLTGSVGARREGEAFDGEYRLDNRTAYAETCAAVGLVLFAHRMLQIEAHRDYADVMERTLYNTVLAAFSLDGKRYFYSNPLSVVPRRNDSADPNGTDVYRRENWLNPACCPSNLGRLLASLGQYAYSRSGDGLYVHLYASGSASIRLCDGLVTLNSQTRYPWDGRVSFTVDVDPPHRFALYLRIPGWCTDYRLAVNGRSVSPPVRNGYAVLRRCWRGGDVVDLMMEMPVERILAHPSIADDVGKIALQRGPVVYCLEQCDHSVPVHGIVLPDTSKLKERYEANLLGGCVTLFGKALVRTAGEWRNTLYQPVSSMGKRKEYKTIPMKAVPYALWGNRIPGAMTIWLNRGTNCFSFGSKKV